MSFKLWIPVLPDKVLSPNVSNLAIAERNAREAMHDQVYFAAMEQVPQPWPHWNQVRVSLAYKHSFKKPKGDPYYRPEDADNAVAACKSIIDALHRELDLFPDDKWEHMILGECRIVKVGRLEDEGVMVIVEEAEWEMVE